jgi:hypothetical protein
MPTPELRAPERPTRAAPALAGRWYDDALTVCMVLVGSTVAATAIIWAGIELRARYELQQLEKAAAAAAARFEAEARKMPRPPEVRRPEVRERLVTVPSKSVEECKAETGGIVNEHFARCRQGYQYVEKTTVRR